MFVHQKNTTKISTLPKTTYRFNPILIKIPMAFFTGRKNNPKICVESQKTPNSQSNLEKEQRWRHHNSLFQKILQCYSNQNSMVLA